MSEFTIQDVVEKLGSYSVLELIALTRQLETLWGVEAKPQTVQQGPKQEQKQESQTQTEFTVSVVSFPADKKMSVLKAVREVTGLGLKESKDFVEAVPKVLKENVTKEEAEELKAKITEAGGVVEVK